MSKIRLMLAISFVVILVIPITSAKDDVIVIDMDDTYTLEIEKDKNVSSKWKVYNTNKNTTYRVEVMIEGGNTDWKFTIEPQTIMLTPETSQTITVYAITKSDIDGEIMDINVIFNISDTEGKVRYNIIKKITYEVVIKVTEKHGVDIFGIHFDLPEILDNNYGRFLIYFLLWFILAIIVTLTLNPLLRAFAKKTKTKMDDILLEIITKPILVLIVVFGVVSSLEQLEPPSWIMDNLYWLYSIVLILVIMYLAYKIFRKVIIQGLKEVAERTETELDDILIPVVDKIGAVLILAFGGISLLGYFGVDVTLFIAGAGFFGLVVAFAAQDTLSNFFAGIFILLDRPFRTGDTIILEDGTYCRVDNIGLRSTKLYDLFQHEYIIFPNNDLAKSKITNVCYPSREFKVKINIGVSYDADPEIVEKALIDVALAHPNTVKEEGKKPFVRLTEYADSSINYLLILWVDDFEKQWITAHEIKKNIYKKFKEMGIEIPYPQRVVYMKKEE